MHRWNQYWLWTTAKYTISIGTNFLSKFFKNLLKGALSGLTQSLATERPLKLMKKFFYFTLQAPLVVTTFKVLSWLFGHHPEKRLD